MFKRDAAGWRDLDEIEAVNKTNFYRVLSVVVDDNSKRIVK